MTSPIAPGSLSQVDDLLDLRERLLKLEERRRAELPGSPEWQAVDSEIERLMRRVWHLNDPSDPPAERTGTDG